MRFGQTTAPAEERPTTPRRNAKKLFKMLKPKLQSAEAFRHLEKATQDEAQATLLEVQEKEWLNSRNLQNRNPPKLPPAIMNTLQEWFSLVDAGSTGYLAPPELLEALKASNLDFNDQLIFEIFKLMDSDRDGYIGWQEFVVFLSWEIAAGKRILEGEYLLPSGHSLPFGAMITRLRRVKLMEEIMEGGESRRKWTTRADWVDLKKDQAELEAAQEALDSQKRRRQDAAAQMLARDHVAFVEIPEEVLSFSRPGTAGSPWRPSDSGGSQSPSWATTPISRQSSGATSQGRSRHSPKSADPLSPSANISNHSPSSQGGPALAIPTRRSRSSLNISVRSSMTDLDITAAGTPHSTKGFPAVAGTPHPKAASARTRSTSYAATPHPSKAPLAAPWDVDDGNDGYVEETVEAVGKRSGRKVWEGPHGQEQVKRQSSRVLQTMFSAVDMTAGGAGGQEEEVLEEDAVRWAGRPSGELHIPRLMSVSSRKFDLDSLACMNRPLEPPQRSGGSNLARLASINHQLLPRFLPRGTSMQIAEADLQQQRLEDCGAPSNTPRTQRDHRFIRSGRRRSPKGGLHKLERV